MKSLYRRVASASIAFGIVGSVTGWALYGSSEPTPPPHDAHTPGKRALIVAISRYDPSTGWADLNSENDIPLVRAVLQRHGFQPSDVKEIQDAEATKTGIVEAFRTTLLEPSGPGDIVVFHYSGHGQQITDNGTDELDGYDETLVPYDAPAELKAGAPYAGEKHLRDDTLNELIQQLRGKVGPRGHVIAFIDSCFSGTPRGLHVARRGDFEEVVSIRGGAPLGDPRAGSPVDYLVDEGGGFFEPNRGARSRGAAASGLAPYIVFSAAQHNEYAYETIGDDGARVGSLSYAMSRELERAAPAMSYRLLFERISWLMSSRVSNHPQVEGDVDAQIFSGRAVPQKPYVEIDSVSQDGSRVTLQAGWLMGLLKGARIAIHREGSPEPSDATLLAEGRVTKSTLAESIITLEKSGNPQELRKGRAFVKAYTYGDLRIRAQLVGFQDSGLRKRLEDLIGLIGAIDLVTEKPQIVVFQVEDRGQTHVVVEAAGNCIPAGSDSRGADLDTCTRILPPLSISEERWIDRVGGRLQDYARNQYLRRLQVVNKELDVGFELIPVALTGCREDEPTPESCNVTEKGPERKLSEGNQREWRVGEWFKIRVTNRSQSDAYLTILQLSSDGSIGMLWPNPRRNQRTELPRGRTPTFLDAHYRLAEPTGTDVLLLVATQEWMNFKPFISTGELLLERGPRGDAGPFAPLLRDEDARRGVTASFAPGRVHTTALTIKVVGNEHRTR